MTAPDSIRELVKRFEENLDSYRSSKYNETQLRREFLDPFLVALGWDVANKQGYAEAYKDVIHEDSLEMEGATKAPDYAFRIGGTRKFFIEAKKPSVNIQSDIHPAFQLRRYTWSAKLAVGILTDFEEFAIYDCLNKPDKKDKASTGRVALYSFRDYVEKWDEISSIFSREAVLKGSFDKFVGGVKGKKGTTEVDDAFLAEIEGWREALARNFALRNASLSTRELNFAVQMTIDRIIFLRICEDRGIERYEKLKDVSEQANVYAGLCQLFRQADLRFNSGLFHFKDEKDISGAADNLTLNLILDDKVLRQILGSLYYPDCPYAFAMISADILGQVYERFLGKVIRLTPGHQAKVEEKPEVRKAGGVYYTPTYIVDYIVKNTVGKLLEGLTPKQAAKIKVLDPACGSGSFLLGAYQYLLDWHAEWYAKNEPEKWAKGNNPAVYQGMGNEWKLTTTEKKRILLDNIHGVDIDSQAVEVTKLSLLLKVLEGESGQLSLGLERALPDLSANIKCGNSLIGPDYYEDQQMTMLIDAEEHLRVNAFDWQKEFPQVFNAGGFDAVIGNPPWGATIDNSDQEYIRKKFKVANASILDTYSIFIEQAIDNLRVNGLLGYIVPDTFLRKDLPFPTRSLLLNATSIVELIETGPVFSKVRDTWCVVIINRKGSTIDNEIRHKKISRYITSAEERLELFNQKKWTEETFVRQSLWLSRPKLIIGYCANEIGQKLITKIEEHPKLGGINEFKISRGEEGSKYNLSFDENGFFQMIIPKNVERYFVGNGINVKNESLTETKIKSLYTHPKIWIIRIQKMRWKQRIVCSFDERKNTAGMKTLQIIVSLDDNTSKLKYLSAILSSKLLNYWCLNYLADDMNQSYLERVPIPNMDAIENFVTLTNTMLLLNNQLLCTNTPQEKVFIQREIEAMDGMIDRLVYELYGLTEEEIRIVEG